MTNTTKSTALAAIDSNALDLDNIQPSIIGIIKHIKDSVDKALGGLTPHEFVKEHNLDLSKDTHKRCRCYSRRPCLDSSIRTAV